MFVTAPANEGLLAMMDDELLPEIRKLAGEARRVTLIFDREGGARSGSSTGTAPASTSSPIARASTASGNVAPSRR